MGLHNSYEYGELHAYSPFFDFILFAEDGGYGGDETDDDGVSC